MSARAGARSRGGSCPCSSARARPSPGRGNPSWDGWLALARANASRTDGLSRSGDAGIGSVMFDRDLDCLASPSPAALPVHAIRPAGLAAFLASEPAAAFLRAGGLHRRPGRDPAAAWPGAGSRARSWGSARAPIRTCSGRCRSDCRRATGGSSPAISRRTTRSWASASAPTNSPRCKQPRAPRPAWSPRRRARRPMRPARPGWRAT